MVRSIQDFAAAAADGKFEWKADARAQIYQEEVEWPVKAVSAGTKGVVTMMWQTPFVKAFADDAASQLFVDNLKKEYLEAVEHYQKKEYSLYWAKLRSMPVPLRLPELPSHHEACVEFTVRDHEEADTFTLVVLKSNLPRLSASEVRKHAPADAKCLLCNPLDANRKPLIDNRSLCKAAHLLLVHGGGDLYLMRTVCSKVGGVAAASGTAEQRAEVMHRYLSHMRHFSKEDMLLHLATHPPQYKLAPHIEKIWTEVTRRATTVVEGFEAHPFFIMDLSSVGQDYAKACVQYRRLRGGLLQGASGKGKTIALQTITQSIGQLELYLFAETAEGEEVTTQPSHVQGTESLLTYTGRPPSILQPWCGDEIKVSELPPDLAKLWLDCSANASSKGYYGFIKVLRGQWRCLASNSQSHNMWHRKATDEDKKAIMRKSIFKEMGKDEEPLLTTEAERFRKEFFRGVEKRSGTTLRDMARRQLEMLLEWHAAPLGEPSYVSGVVPGAITAMRPVLPQPCEVERDAEDHEATAMYYKRKFKEVVGSTPSPPPKKKNKAAVACRDLRQMFGLV